MFILMTSEIPLLSDVLYILAQFDPLLNPHHHTHAHTDALALQPPFPHGISSVCAKTESQLVGLGLVFGSLEGLVHLVGYSFESVHVIPNPAHDNFTPL